jgi:tRNA (cmo5U34)-methyltransferase
MEEYSRNEKIRRHFNEEAESFDPWISSLAPYYSEAIKAMVSALCFDPGSNIRVADLGCGTGSVALAVKERFPDSEIYCVDLSENMLEEAREKLAPYNGIEFHEADIKGFRQEGRYDAVLSSLCLHHIEDQCEKQDLFRNVFDSLVPGGMFIVYDVVLSSDDKLQNVYMNKWKEFMRERIPPEEVERVLELYKEEDRPFSLTEELARLEKTGFSRVDVILKYYNSAVYAGIK